MKLLIASTPATGHLNPLLAIGHILIAEDHEVVGLSGSALRERIVHTVEDGKTKRTYHLEGWAGAMRQLSGDT
jgi:UDP:flavonoid glycosyltransferase YjiC (YdhE family)